MNPDEQDNIDEKRWAAAAATSYVPADAVVAVGELAKTTIMFYLIAHTAYWQAMRQSTEPYLRSGQMVM